MALVDYRSLGSQRQRSWSQPRATSNFGKWHPETITCRLVDLDEVDGWIGLRQHLRHPPGQIVSGEQPAAVTGARVRGPRPVNRWSRSTAGGDGPTFPKATSSTRPACPPRCSAAVSRPPTSRSWSAWGPARPANRRTTRPRCFPGLPDRRIHRRSRRPLSQLADSLRTR